MKSKPTLKILIADDESVNLQFLSELLTMKKYEALTATNGTECLDSLEANKDIDLILLDIMMPEMDGYEVCRIIKSKEDLKHIPIIFVTAIEDDSSQVKALQAGAADYITKPIKKEVLMARVDNHLKLKLANDELTKTRKLDKALLDSLPHPAMIINHERKIVAANKVALGLGAELQHYCWGKFMKAKYISEGDRLRYKGGDANGIKCMFCCADKIIDKQATVINSEANALGKIWHMYWKHIGEDDKGDPLFLHYAIDITEHKEMENVLKQYQVHLEELVKERTRKLEKAKIEAESANKAKSDFLSTMTHELTTPLNGILGFTDLIKIQNDAKLSEKQNLYLNRVKESGQHLLTLINDILDISMIEAGRMKLTANECKINGLLENTLSLLRSKALSKGIEFVTEFDKDINIKADETKLKQIIFNIISNAVKFTSNTGTVTIKTKKIENKFILISVKDTGIGIEHKDKHKVLNHFEQVDTGHTRKFGGVGIGMPLTKRLIELHNGKIWFESEGKNKGTCFFVQLPIKSQNTEIKKG